MIPKKLHTIWIGSQVPNIDFSKEWDVFDDWEVTHWDDSKVKEEFHDDDFLTELYEKEGPTKVSDYVRLIILKKYGGVYSDKDVVFLRPIDSFLNLKSFLTYQFPRITKPKMHLPKGEKLKDHFEGKNKISLFEFYNEDIYLNNSIIGSVSGGKMIDIFLKTFIEDYRKPIAERFSYVDYGCGPAMTTYVGNLFVDLDGSTKHCEDVSIFESSIFHPSNYIENKNALKTRDFKRSLENQIKKGKELNSYCVHIQSSSECDSYKK